MKAVGVRELREYRSLAQRNAGKKGSDVILRLCDEVDRLRSIKQHRNGSLDEDSLWPYGKHKGKLIHQVPRDYLSWWARAINREALQVDASVGKFPEKAVAVKKLKLLDFIEGSILIVNDKSG